MGHTSVEVALAELQRWFDPEHVRALIDFVDSRIMSREGVRSKQDAEWVAKLTAERDAALAEVEKFKTSTVGTLVADAVRADRESDERECRREIRRLRAEVKRLTSGKWTPQEVNDLCHDLPKVVGPRAYADGCAKQQRELFGCAPDADRIAELEARAAIAAKEEMEKRDGN